MVEPFLTPRPSPLFIDDWHLDVDSSSAIKTELFIPTDSLDIVGAFDESIRDIQRIFIFALFFFNFELIHCDWYSLHMNIYHIWNSLFDHCYREVAHGERRTNKRTNDRISYNITVIVVYVPDSVGSLRSIVNIVLEAWWRANKHIHFAWLSSLLWLS